MTYILNTTVSGSGPVLVLVHGVAGGIHIWDPVVAELSRYFTVVRLDLLGYGHSPKPSIDYTPEVHATAIRDTLTELAIEVPFTMVGLSMGVNLALKYAALWPDEVDAIVAIGFPYFATADEAKKNLRNNIWVCLTLERPLLARIFIPVVWWLGRKRIIDPTPFSKIYTRLMMSESLLNPYRVFKSTLFHCMITNRLETVLAASAQKPRLFINGENDKWATVENVQNAIRDIPDSKLTIIPRASHNVVILEPALTARHIIDFVQKHHR